MVEPVCYDAIESVLKDKLYNDSSVPKWIDEICSKVMKDLIEMNKPFKYLGTIFLINYYFF
jgi:hypothetical protein